MGAAARLPFTPRMVSSYWAYRRRDKSDFARPPQIDVVAINEDAHQVIVGECKWTGSAMTAVEVNYFLGQCDKMLPWASESEKWTVTYAFFCRSGFAPEARAAVGDRPCIWVDLKTLDTGLRRLARTE